MNHALEVLGLVAATAASAILLGTLIAHFVTKRLGIVSCNNYDSAKCRDLDADLNVRV